MTYKTACYILVFLAWVPDGEKGKAMLRIAASIVMSMQLVGQAETKPAASQPEVSTDLLVVGGTESGWAAAIQAARMGVPSITLVNDIEWLGGQFTAEALVAVDENRSLSETSSVKIRRNPPFPRSGLFRELTDRIEAFNERKYGHPQPGNTGVRTTCRPSEAEAIFREMIQPFVDSGQLTMISGYYPIAAEVDQQGQRLAAVRFGPTATFGEGEPITVRAKITIDASDWGEAIQAAGAEIEFGPDPKSRYGEALAPKDPKNYPLTDMNPITYCMIIEESEEATPIARPDRYDERRYRAATGATWRTRKALGWTHRPIVGPVSAERIYGSRRIVDRHALAKKAKADSILLCWAVQDYPLDQLPGVVVEQLERDEPGASKKNIATMTRKQRQLVFEDAKLHSLGLLYYLQTTVHDWMPDKSRSFRRFNLSDEFGTPDKLPFKPYIRESLRLVADYMMRQQDTTGIPNSEGFARVMYHDGISAWQFEYDFHPTGRAFLPGEGPSGPWESYFKEGRRWGPPYAGRSLFPLRSLVPRHVDGLLGAQKNLGYSSIVSSAIRLHDQCIAIGQAAGAVAAVSLANDVQPWVISGNPTLLAEVRDGLCRDSGNAVPLTLWPYRDLEPADPSFAAVNRLAVRQVFPWKSKRTAFRPEEPATEEWRRQVMARSLAGKIADQTIEPPQETLTRGEFARRWWGAIKGLPDKPFVRKGTGDADGDGIADHDDAAPFDRDNNNLMDHLETTKSSGQ
ncbi:FAD dependent oxidoreductase [Planctomycetes bacterium Pan216]|uniref:FAD dependent oxidoreductase n=1 Tax=Kolteria novifilia TaxID=2527975 RepID=A0A518AX11_9BACT|nr:FAD dependent oxidoreductase [Planctomycetes bacterium Pan216]